MLENEYYMVDLPLVLDEKRKHNASKILTDITVRALPTMDENVRSEILDELRKEAGQTFVKNDEPDVEGLAKLKSMLSRK